MKESKENREVRTVRWLAVAALVSICSSWIASHYIGARGVSLASVALLPAVLVHVALTYPVVVPLVRSFSMAIWVPYLTCTIPAVIGVRAAATSPEAESVLRAAMLGASALASSLLTRNLVRAVSKPEQPTEAIAARTGLIGLVVALSSLIGSWWWSGLSIGVAALPVSVLIGSTWMEVHGRTAASARGQNLHRESPAITLQQVGVELAHAMRKPLEAVSNQLVESMRRMTDPQERGRLKDSVELLAHMQGLIAGVLDLSRGQSKPRFRRLRLETLFDQAIQEVHRRFPDAVIQLKPIDGTLHGDEVTLRCVMVNLLENALEASVENAWVCISAERLGEWFEIVVEDRSGGLPETVRAQLFEPFVTTKEGGVGLGLATVREACLAHGGQVAAEGTPNGTRFVIRLPAQAR